LSKKCLGNWKSCFWGCFEVITVFSAIDFEIEYEADEIVLVWYCVFGTSVALLGSGRIGCGCCLTTSAGLASGRGESEGFPGVER